MRDRGRSVPLSVARSVLSNRWAEDLVGGEVHVAPGFRGIWRVFPFDGSLQESPHIVSGEGVVAERA